MPDQFLEKFLEEMRNSLSGAFEIAEACLVYSFQASNESKHFDSAAVRMLDVRRQISGLVTGHVPSSLSTSVVNSLARSIEGSNNPPLAAWFTADWISVAISQNFKASTDGPPVYDLQHLRAFFLSPEGCSALYRTTKGLSERPGPERDQFNASKVRGLALWIVEPSVGPFKVIVDRAGGEQFNAGLNDKGIDIALIQPNRTLRELSVDHFSKSTDPEPKFFGVGPRGPEVQSDNIFNNVEAATKAGAQIVVLPELVTTKPEALALFDRIDKMQVNARDGAGPRAFDKSLRVVVAGSFHHVDSIGERRNTVAVHFPNANPPLNHREHHKSGDFFIEMNPQLRDALGLGGGGHSWMDKKKFRENVQPSFEIRLYSGSSFTAVVLICSDFLNETVMHVLRKLQPSLILICNMTHKVDGFFSAAQGLVASGQSTTVAVNNPAMWPSEEGTSRLMGLLSACRCSGPRTACGERALLTRCQY